MARHSALRVYTSPMLERETVMKSTRSIIAATLLLVACGGKQPDMVVTAANPAKAPAVAGASALPSGHPDISTVANKQQQPAAHAGRLTGKVLETMNAGGYTYLKLQTAQGPAWAAVRQFKTKAGDTVSVNAEMTMENFESKTLNRKFDAIIFGVLADRAATTAPPATAQAALMPASMMNPMGSPAQHMSAPAVDVKVEKAEGGKSVAEVWAGRTQLSEKPVVVRGKVVKFLGGIMGRNWLHLRDGSGSREKGDDDLTVTTTEVANVGDVVTVSGTVRVDKDFGAGYRYPVIIEDASFRK